MENPSEYLGLLITFALSLGIAAAMLFLNSILGPKGKSTAAKREPFECGMPATKQTHGGRFSIHFYLVAMLFILFDVEIVWFFPWAVILRELGWYGIGAMFAFVGLLALGYVFAWKKGALEWQGS